MLAVFLATKMENKCAKGILFLTMFVICFCVGGVNAGGRRPTPKLKEKVTHLEFYMHDIMWGENATVVQVAPQKPMNSSSAGSPSFGPMYVIDDPLTKTPHPKSKLLGRAQGLYAMVSQGELSLLMALTYTMESGRYKGSTLSIMGKNMVMRNPREMPIVGGSGHFRMARGYAFAQTYSIDGPNAVIGYNVTVFHYGRKAVEAL